jgi:hypothetical protein
MTVFMLAGVAKKQQCGKASTAFGQGSATEGRLAEKKRTIPCI